MPAAEWPWRYLQFSAELTQFPLLAQYQHVFEGLPGAYSGSPVVGPWKGAAVGLNVDEGVSGSSSAMAPQVGFPLGVRAMVPVYSWRFRHSSAVKRQPLLGVAQCLFYYG
jgi:hypothetical protein